MMRDLLQEAYGAMQHNRRRTMLTMLGMAWGIATVVILLAFGSGFQRAISLIFSSWGTDVIGVFPGRTSLQAGGAKAGSEVRLKIADVDYVRNEVPMVKGVTPIFNKQNGVPIQHDTRTFTNLFLNGVYPVFQRIRGFNVATGRGLSEQDELEHGRVAVIGDEARRRLFSGQPALGQSIRIAGVSFQVIGIYQHKVTLFGEIVRKGHDDVQAERFVAYPSKALREALVNAVYHRGYEGTSLAVRVALYPDRVEITSYPGPVPGLLAEHLLAGARPPQVPARNPLVGEMLKALRLAETWHTGVPKIHRVMDENGSPAPRFDFDEGRTYFRVTLPAHPGYVVLHALREAAVLWHTGEQQRAIAVLRDASTRVPEAGSVAAQEIEYLADTGDLPAARKVFSRLEQTEGARDRHLAYMALARAYLDVDQRDEAAALLSNAPRPSATRSQVDLAILHKRSRDLESAHRQFSSIAAQIQTDARALHEWAQTKIALARKIPTEGEVAPVAKQQLLREALDMLSGVTQLSHDQPGRASWAWFDIAKVHATLQDPEASIEDALARALTLNPSEPQFHEWRAQRAARSK